MTALIRYDRYKDHPHTGHFISMLGEEVYKVDGNYHREDGPAKIHASGNVSWWLKGRWFSFEEYVIEAKWTDEQIIEWKLTN